MLGFFFAQKGSKKELSLITIIFTLDKQIFCRPVDPAFLAIWVYNGATTFRDSEKRPGTGNELASESSPLLSFFQDSEKKIGN